MSKGLGGSWKNVVQHIAIRNSLRLELGVEIKKGFTMDGLVCHIKKLGLFMQMLRFEDIFKHRA